MFTVTDAGLKQQRILVTRPRKQSGQLAELIGRAGGEAVLFPVIEITPVARTEWLPANLDKADWLIFVSRNAVDSFISQWPGALPEQLRLAAVGDGTASAMRDKALAVDCQPKTSTGSEGLLAMPEMQEMAGKHVLIVRGVGGRELLADTLKARGATIDYIEVYRRGLVSYDRQACLEALQADKLVCTSAAGIDNLCRIMGDFEAELLSKPLVVISERLRMHALSQGFGAVEVSADASDAAVCQTLIEMDKHHGE